MAKFTPNTVSAGEDAINGCLQSGGDCCLELLGESLEEIDTTIPSPAPPPSAPRAPTPSIICLRALWCNGV